MAEPGDNTDKPANVVTGDSGPGSGLADLLPMPANVNPVTDPGRKEVSNSLAQDTTLSHALATDDHEKKGHAQKDHNEAEVRDLGWNEKQDRIARPLVGGINNEELWMLVRRFNKVRQPLTCSQKGRC